MPTDCFLEPLWNVWAGLLFSLIDQLLAQGHESSQSSFIHSFRFKCAILESYPKSFFFPLQQFWFINLFFSVFLRVIRKLPLFFKSGDFFQSNWSVSLPLLFWAYPTKFLAPSPSLDEAFLSKFPIFRLHQSILTFHFSHNSFPFPSFPVCFRILHKFILLCISSPCPAFQDDFGIHLLCFQVYFR